MKKGFLSKISNKTARVIICLSVMFSAVFIFPLSGCKGAAENITKYTVNAHIGEDMTVSGEEEVVFFNNTENVFSILKFNLFPNAYREDAKIKAVSDNHRNKAYYDGESYGRITVKEVTDGDNNLLKTEISGEDRNILCVYTEKEIFPEESFTVNVSFETVLAKVIARTGINRKTVNLANFYPELCGIEDGGFYECAYTPFGDPFFSNPADFTVTLEVPEGYVIAGGGERVNAAYNREGEEGSSAVTYSIAGARSFAAVLSRNFDFITTDIEGTEINYYFDADDLKDGDTEERAALKAAADGIKLFSALFGKYPFKTFTVVKTPFIEGGMEFSGIVFVSDELQGGNLYDVIAHETAHQWWQAGVGNNEIENPFVDEGLAEYSTCLFYENYPEYGVSYETAVKNAELTFKTFCTVFDKLYKTKNTAMLRSVKDYSSEYEYVNIVYVKPVVMFDIFRKTVGDEKFFSGLRRYYADNVKKTASPYSIVGAFEKVGVSADGFFTAFYEGKEAI